MSWLEAQITQYGEGFGSDLHRFIESSAVDQALNQLAGRFGVRRFMVRCARKNAAIEIQEVESISLQFGGGPPNAQSKKNVSELEKALNRLYNTMLGGPVWDRSAIGFVRDCDNQFTIYPFFDEDSDQISLNEMPIPEKGHPLEGNEFRQLSASMEAQLIPIIQRSHSTSGSWDLWKVQGRELKLIYGDPAQPQSVDTHKCQILAVFGSNNYWEWQVEEPLFEEEVYCWENFLCDWDSAMELGFVTTSRLKADWLFSSVVEGTDLSLFVAVWD